MSNLTIIIIITKIKSKEVQREDAANLKLGETTLVENLKTGAKYKFLGVRESVMQDDKQALTVAAKTHLQRLSIICTSPLYDVNCVKAKKQGHLVCLNVPYVDPTLAIERAAKH